MHIRSCLTILLVVVLASATWSATASARGRGPGGRPQHHENRPTDKRPGDHVERPANLPGDHELGDRIGGTPESRPHLRNRQHRRCRDKARRGIPGGCYLSGGDWVEDAVINEAPPAARQDASTTRPSSSKPLQQQTGVSVISPSGNDALKEELISARRNWMEKKHIYEDTAAERARAEYRAQQSGGQVDPALIERQQQAADDAAIAQAAIGPVVERARSAGFSSEILDLYERANRGN